MTALSYGVPGFEKDCFIFNALRVLPNSQEVY